MSVRDMTPRGFTMAFDVDLTNPNTVDLPLGAADYTLSLAGIDVLTGSVQPTGSIPARESRVVVVPVDVTFEDLLKAEEGIRDSGPELRYLLEGGLSCDTGLPVLGVIRVPLRYSGTVKLRQLLGDAKLLQKNAAAQRLAERIGVTTQPVLTTHPATTKAAITTRPSN